MSAVPTTALGVIDADEIALAVVAQGSGIRSLPVRFRIRGGIQPILNNQFPPAISIGEQGRDTQPFASTATYADFSSGIGVYRYDPSTSRARYWWGTLDTRRKNGVSLLPKKIDRTNPHAGVDPSSRVTAGIQFAGLDLVVWDRHVYGWNELAQTWNSQASPGAPSNGQPLYSLTAPPTSDPVIWNGYCYFFTGQNVVAYNGSAFTLLSQAAIAGVPYGGQLWLLYGTGAIKKADDWNLATLTNVATGVGGNGKPLFVDDTAVGMTTYFDGQGTPVPYIIGKRRLYSIDASTGAIYPTGPAMPPHKYPISAAEWPSDRWMYIAQAMSVVQWNGELAQDVGFINDDGVPPEINGSIVKLVTTERDIFALVTKLTQSSTQALGTAELADWNNDYEVPSSPIPAYSALFARRGAGWHPLAVADSNASAATACFVSYYETDYRVWFAWGNTVYTVDLEYGFTTPANFQTGQFEPSGVLITPWNDYGYYEETKIALLAELRCTITPGNGDLIRAYIAWDYDENNWIPLTTEQGQADFIASGRYRLPIHASTFYPWVDAPPSGRTFDTFRLKAELVRGTADTSSPILTWFGLHCIKSVPVVRGWSFEIDMTDTYNNRTPMQQWDALAEIVAANNLGLVHFSYQDDPDATGGQARVYPVKLTGITGLTEAGPSGVGTVRVTLSEVIDFHA